MHHADRFGARPDVSRVVVFNKPYGVLTQFTVPDGRPTLADYIPLRDVYPAGRLDADSEGLVILVSDGALQARISHPRHKSEKTYWAQVEGSPDDGALERLCQGIDLGDFVTRPCRARWMAEPAQLWPRDPPICYRKAIPTSWIELVLSEGKNRQVRRMTAKVGFPTLRLVRWAVGAVTLDSVPSGTWRALAADEVDDLFRSIQPNRMSTFSNSVR